MPALMRISGRVGEYSNISPSGDGIKPATTRPMPFSIHIESMIAMQTTASTVSFFRIAGLSMRMRLIQARTIENQIQGVRDACPLSPKKR